MISLTSPIRTKAHDWPASFKLGSLCITTALLFLIEDIWVLISVFTFVMLTYALPGKVFFLNGLRQLRMLWPFILIVGIWHVWTGSFVDGGVIVVRLVSAVALANLVTMTTKLSDMIDVISVILRPLHALGLKPKVVEIAIALVIRLTPVLVSKGSQLSDAWRARSERAPSWRIILPFTILALDDTDHVADALKARGGLES
jgi:biotin transport system permease protein